MLMRKTIETVGIAAIANATMVTDLSQLQLDASSGPTTLLESAAETAAGRLGMQNVEIALGIEPEAKHGVASRYVEATEGTLAEILVAEETLADPLRAFMEVAYQYSAHFWRCRPEPSELELHPKTTSLLPICYGLGVLASDASLYDQQWSHSGFSGWSMSRSGYYNTEEIGYATALFARARGEQTPAWTSSLRLDSQVTAKKAWRFFAKHEKSGGQLLFDADKVPGTARDMTELANWLRGDDPAFALAAAYALRASDNLSALAVAAAIDATHSDDPAVVPAATRLLGLTRHSSPEVQSRVEKLIVDPSPFTSLFALESAADLGMSLDAYQPKIVQLLSVFEEDPWPLLDLIGRTEPRLSAVAPALCEQLERALRQGPDESASNELARTLVHCIEKVHENAEEIIGTHIKHAETRDQALQYLVTTKS
jgi:hypothetical protein